MSYSSALVPMDSPRISQIWENNKAAIAVVEYDEDKVDLSREQAKDMEKK